MQDRRHRDLRRDIDAVEQVRHGLIIEFPVVGPGPGQTNTLEGVVFIQTGPDSAPGLHDAVHARKLKQIILSLPILLVLLGDGSWISHVQRVDSSLVLGGGFSRQGDVKKDQGQCQVQAEILTQQISLGSGMTEGAATIRLGEGAGATVFTYVPAS